MSRVFIVDTENTNDLRFLNCFNVNYSDSIYFLFNRNSKKLEWNSTRDLIYVNCNVEFIELHPTGLPNGLDFQISNFLGTLLEKLNNMVNGYYIVSKDKGFLANKGIINELYPDIVFEVIDPETCGFLGNEELMKSDNYEDKLCASDLRLNPSTSPNIESNVSSKVKAEMENIIRDYMKGYFYDNEIDKCLEMFFKSNTLRDLNNKLVNALSNTEGNECYKCVKGFFGKSIVNMRHHANSNPISKFIDNERILIYNASISSDVSEEVNKAS